MSDIADKVRRAIVEHLGVDKEKVTDTASLIDDLGADSLDIVEVVMAVEEACLIEIPDVEAEKMSLVGDIIRFAEAAPKLPK